MVDNIFKTVLNNNKNADFLECSYSSIFSETYKCEDIYNYWTDDTVRFETEGNPNDYVQIHVKNFYIIPSSYTIQTINLEADHSHLKSWILSASNNGQTWLEIDKQENVNELNGYLLKHTFPIKDYGIPFSYFRITVIKSCSSTHINRLSLHQIDFSGLIRNLLFCSFTFNKNRILFNPKFFKVALLICLICS